MGGKGNIEMKAWGPAETLRKARFLLKMILLANKPVESAENIHTHTCSSGQTWPDAIEGALTVLRLKPPGGAQPALNPCVYLSTIPTWALLLRSYSIIRILWLCDGLASTDLEAVRVYV